MVQQGRVLAAALADAAVLDADSVGRLFARLEPRGDARYRVYDSRGALLGDSARGRAAVRGEPITRYEASSNPSTCATGALSARRVAREFAKDGPIMDRSCPERRRPASNCEGPSLKCRRLSPAGTVGDAAHARTAIGDDVQCPAGSPRPVPSRASCSCRSPRFASCRRCTTSGSDLRVVVASLVTASVLTALASMTIVGPFTGFVPQALAIADRDPLPVVFRSGSRRRVGDSARHSRRSRDASTNSTSSWNRLPPMCHTNSGILSRRSARPRK